MKITDKNGNVFEAGNAFREIAILVLLVWSTMNLLWGYFSFGYFYSEIKVFERLIAIIILWGIGTRLLPMERAGEGAR